MKILYHFSLCPFSRKIRHILGELGQKFDLLEIYPWKINDHFMKISPFGTLPVLCDHDLVVNESIVIAEYLDEKYGGGKFLLGKNRKERNEIRKLEVWFDIKFYFEVTKDILYERIIKFKALNEAPNIVVIRKSMEYLKMHLHYINDILKQAEWIAKTNHMTVADITAASHISCLDFLGFIEWEGFKDLKMWFYKVKSQKTFRPFLEKINFSAIHNEKYYNLDF